MDFDNRAKLFVGGKEYEVAASNGACKLYADEFRGKVDEPFNGAMLHDATREFTDAVEGDGAMYLTWSELPRSLGAVWAMARAAGSTKDSFKAFAKKVDEGPAVTAEVTAYFDLVFVNSDGLGARAFFRNPAGQGDAGEPDQG